MSRSSGERRPTRGSTGSRIPRGQVEPTVALVATVSICLSLGLYAVAIDGAMPSAERDLAPTTLDRVHNELRQGGVVVPERRAIAHGAGPAGYQLNLTVRGGHQRWSEGPPPPGGGDRATRQVSVRTGDDRIRVGRLEVTVWS